MPLPDSLLHTLAHRLSKHLGRTVTVDRETPVGGGSISDSYLLDTTAGRYFVKVDPAARTATGAPHFPSMFAAEADGLERLASTCAIRIPKVIATGDEDFGYLLLERIECRPTTSAFWTVFGHALARLHGNAAPHFGLDRDNWIGPLKQMNARTSDWTTFFIQQRLEPQVKSARDNHRLGMGEVLRFERLYMKLPVLIPTEPPALLHGDLWHGNFLCDEREQPVLIDPAVYFGHREMDIAMSRLFGGFDASFYEGYNAERPLERGWEERMDLHNLYPLLVHLNLFEGGYAQQVRAVLGRYV